MGYLIIFIPLSLVVGKGHLLVNHTYFFIIQHVADVNRNILDPAILILGKWPCGSGFRAAKSRGKMRLSRMLTPVLHHNENCCSRSIADVVKMGSNRWANRADHASIFEDILRHEMEKIWMFDLKTGIFD